MLSAIRAFIMANIEKWMYEDKAVQEFLDCYYPFYTELGSMKRKEFSVEKKDDMTYIVRCTIQSGKVLEFTSHIDHFSMSLYALHAVRMNPEEMMIYPTIVIGRRHR